MKSVKLQKTNNQGNDTSRPKKRKKISESYLYNAGLYYLERFPASIAHFKIVMNRKIERSFTDHPQQDRDEINTWLDSVVNRFIELGYLNDRLYARGVITSLRRKGTSSTKIFMTLRQKGVERALTAEILQIVDEDMKSAEGHEGDDALYNPDLQAALAYCRRKRMTSFDYNNASLDHEAQSKLKNKYLGRLARQGFSYVVASKALELARDPQDKD